MPRPKKNEVTQRDSQHLKMDILCQEAVRGLWDRDWLPIVSGKQALYNGIAQYHQSRVCNADKVGTLT